MVRKLALCLALSSIAACERASSITGGSATPPASTSVPVAEPRELAPAVTTSANEILVPTGHVFAGSAPGTSHRHSPSELPATRVRVPAYVIDRFAYPNDPSSAPRTGVDPEEAGRLCADAGKRLCVELEWERACEGDDNRIFSTGDTMDVEACALDPGSCASAFGVVGAGTAMREWTRESLNPDARAIVRGADAIDPIASHRCATRVPREAIRRGASEIGFRCCRSATNEMPPAYATVRATTVGVGAELSEDRARELFAVAAAHAVGDARALMTELSRSFEFHSVSATAGVAGTNINQHGLVQAPRAFEWSPVVGERILVISGHIDDRSIVSALYASSESEPPEIRHAATIELERGGKPVPLLFHADQPRELLFSTCIGCGAEGGAIVYDAQSLVQIVPR